MLRDLRIYSSHKNVKGGQINHIQYNIGKRLMKGPKDLPTRLDLDIYSQKTSQNELTWNDKKRVKVQVGIEESVAVDPETKEGVALLYEIIFDALYFVWNANNWDAQLLDEAYTEIKAEDYISSVIYGKKIFSKDRSLSAEFVCNLFTDRCELFIEIASKREKTKHRLKFFETKPDPESFFMFFRERYWVGNDHVIVNNISKDIFFVIDAKNLTCTIEYRPMDTSLEHCQNFLKALEPGDDPAALLKWMKG
jgi:hypothetical protein